MANKIQKFFHEKFGKMRGVYYNGECWFVGKDIAQALGYKRDTKAVVDHVYEEYRIMVDGKTQSQFGIQLGQRGGWLIKEAGIYQLIFTSQLPEAKEFVRWICEEVLPTIRRTGMWQEIRQDGKAIRRNLTDTVKTFLAYLKETNQLDRADVAWYVAFTNLVNKKVGVDTKRDDLTYLELLRVQDCEDVLVDVIEDGIANKKAHHDIWLECNAKLNVE